MGTLKDQPQLQDDYWNLNITSKFVGKDASGLKWFECDILCSYHKNILRLTGRSSSAKRGSKLGNWKSMKVDYIVKFIISSM